MSWIAVDTGVKATYSQLGVEFDGVEDMRGAHAWLTEGG